VPYSAVERSHGPAIAALALAVAFVVLAAQNSRSVDLHLLLWELRTPLYGLAVVSALLGAVVVEASAGLWRHRRQARERDHRELLRLRRSRPGRSGVQPPRSG
jgi:uncharacterized integral membrane protein